MPSVYYYRYVGDDENEFVERNHIIESHSGITWLTPDVYNTGAEAREMLALEKNPLWRIRPIPAEEILEFDHCPLRRVGPDNNEDGGGWECATTRPIRLYTVTRLA